MNIRITIAATALVLVTAFSGLAFANISTGSIRNDVQSAVGSGNVSVIVDEGIATIFGSVETRMDKNAAQAAAIQFPGIDKVVNSIVVLN